MRPAYFSHETSRPTRFASTHVSDFAESNIIDETDSIGTQMFSYDVKSKLNLHIVHGARVKQHDNIKYSLAVVWSGAGGDGQGRGNDASQAFDTTWFGTSHTHTLQVMSSCS